MGFEGSQEGREAPTCTNIPQAKSAQRNRVQPGAVGHRMRTKGMRGPCWQNRDGGSPGRDETLSGRSNLAALQLGELVEEFKG